MTVIAYHLIWTSYGTWLPNDPRGSGSHNVYTPFWPNLVTHISVARKSNRPAPRCVSFIRRQKLDYSILCFASMRLIDHVHMVIRKHKHDGDARIASLQFESRARIIECNITVPDHPVWTKKGWKVFLSTPEEVRQRISYVERNPLKEGLPRPVWPFVTPYDNWPFHKQLKRKRRHLTRQRNKLSNSLRFSL